MTMKKFHRDLTYRFLDEMYKSKTKTINKLLKALNGHHKILNKTLNRDVYFDIGPDQTSSPHDDAQGDGACV